MNAEDSPVAQLWAERYARRSGVTVDWLRRHGREVRRCECGEEGCEGWQMAHVGEDDALATLRAALAKVMTPPEGSDAD